MAQYVVDTHALFWHITKSARLGSAARVILQAANSNGDRLLVPTIVLAELYFVNEKYGKPFDYSQTVGAMQLLPEYGFVDLTIADLLQFDALVGIVEMHDRIVVSVAHSRGLPILTKDQVIVQSGLVQTIW